MKGMEFPSKPSVRQRALCVLGAIYLPNFVAFAMGVGHCDVCQRAWLWIVWILPAGVVHESIRNTFDLPRISNGATLATVFVIQAVWIAGWCWLASLGRRSFSAVLIVCFGVSCVSAWGAFALIRA